MIATLLVLASFSGFCRCFGEQVICSNFDNEVKLADSLLLLVPGSAHKPLESLSGAIFGNERINWITSIRVPISALLSKGIFTVHMKKPPQFNSIALYERPSFIRDLGCRLSGFLTFDSLSSRLCACSNSGSMEIDSSSGEYWCVIYPCSSKDAAAGYCIIDVNPFANSCIRSTYYSPEDITYKLGVPMVHIPVPFIGTFSPLLPYSIDVPLFAFRLSVSSLLVILSFFKRFRAFIIAAFLSHCVSAVFQHIFGNRCVG